MATRASATAPAVPTGKAAAPAIATTLTVAAVATTGTTPTTTTTAHICVIHHRVGDLVTKLVIMELAVVDGISCYIGCGLGCTTSAAG